MDKIKNILSSGDGQTSQSGDFDNKYKVSGEGSHFGSNQTTTTTGQPMASEPEPTSHMPGAFADDTATTASIASGIPGKAQTANPIPPTEPTTTSSTKPAVSEEPSTIGTAVTSGSGGATLGPVTSEATGGTLPGPPTGDTGSNDKGHVSSDVGGYETIGKSDKEWPDGTQSGNTAFGGTGDKDTSLGSGTAGTAATSAVGSAALADRTKEPASDSVAPDTTRSFPLVGSSGETNRPSDYAPGQIGVYHAGGEAPSASKTTGPHSIDMANKLDPRVNSDQDGSKTIGTTGTTDPTTSTGPKDHTVRDTALGAGAGLGAGSVLASQSGEPGTTSTAKSFEPTADTTRSTADPVTSTTTTSTKPVTGTSHATESKAAPSTTTAATPGLTSTNKDAPAEHKPAPYETAKPSQDHTTRDTALVGGAAATGFGASEAVTHDPTDPRSPATGPAPNTAGPHKSDLLNKLDPRVDSDLSKQKSKEEGTSGSTAPVAAETTSKGEENYKRDAAVAGAGGVGGVAAYEAAKDKPTTEGTVAPATTTAPTSTDKSLTSSEPRTDSAAHPSQGGHPTKPITRESEDEKGENQSHDGRNAALAGGAGAAGLAGGALAANELSDQDAKNIEKEESKEQKALEKQHSKEEKEHEKAVAKEQKQHEKEAAKEQKAIEKQHAKEEKEHDKAVAKEQKAHDKAAAKEEKEREKEEKEEEKEKKGGLLGFLKRDKTDDEVKDGHTAHRESAETSRDGFDKKDAAVVAGAGAAGAGAGAAATSGTSDVVHNPENIGTTGPSTSGGETISQAAAQDSKISSGSGIAGPADSTTAGTHDSAFSSGSGIASTTAVGSQAATTGSTEPRSGVIGSGDTQSRSAEQAVAEAKEKPFGHFSEGSEKRNEPSTVAAADTTTTSKASDPVTKDFGDPSTTNTNTTSTTTTSTTTGKDDTVPPAATIGETAKTGDEDTVGRSNTTGSAGANTTHEAYGAQEGRNKLHKDPPQKVLEQRGLS